MAIRSLLLLLSALVAELAASWWLWARAPTDTIRVIYSGFWSYEAERLFCWVILSPICLVIGLILWRALSAFRNRSGRLFRLFPAGVGPIMASALELSTSVWYWSAQSSRPMRDLYGSIWYWHRVPQPGDQGWPSLRGYIGDHALAWCIALLMVQGVLWVALKKWQRRCPDEKAIETPASRG